MKRIFLIPHTHYDVAWAFNKEDYLHINETILKRALEMIEKEDFCFLIEQTYLLEQIEYRDPKLFGEIKKAIMNEKLEIADGQYLMPDPMIPDGEVLVREILFGKKYAKEKFGVEVIVAWAADGFGLNAQLPQILKKSGYKYLSFRRGIPRSIGYRVSEFWWEGLDGTKILTHWMPKGYRAGLYLDKWEESFLDLDKLATTDNIMMPCGSGGAIPQPEIPQKVREWNEKHPNIKMEITTPRAFFKALEKDVKNLITYKGELYSAELENIFPDVVSSRISLKMAIRECENILLNGEKMMALSYLAGKPYPLDSMERLWKQMLFLAFHDIVPSCGIDEIYQEAWEYIERIKKDIPSLSWDSLNHIVTHPDNSDEIGIVVFNPNSWNVKKWVEADLKLGAGWEEVPAVVYEGKEVPTEIIDVEYWDDESVRSARVGFMAEVPSFGFKVYGLKKREKKYSPKIKIKGEEVETKFYKVRVDEKTGIIIVFDKKTGEKIFSGNEIIIDEEIGDLYFHEEKLKKIIKSESGEGIHFGDFKPEELTIKKGVNRVEIKYKTAFYCLRWPYYLTEKFGPMLYRHKSMEITKYVYLYNDSPIIDFKTELNLKQSHVRVRLKFDTEMVAPSYARQTQFGVIDLPKAVSLEKNLKIPSLSWLVGEENGRGILFLTHGVPINEIKGAEIFLTLLRSVGVLAADGKSGPLIPTPEALELGYHVYTYSIYPYKGNWKEEKIFQKGVEFTQPLVAYQVDNVLLDEKKSFFQFDVPNLVISALKKTETEKSLILRFYETAGLKTEAVLSLPSGINKVELANLIEKSEKELNLKNGKVKLKVSPFEIVTLKLYF